MSADTSLNATAATVASSMPPAPKLFEPVLARLRAEALEHFGTAGARLVPLAYEQRPFSHLLRVGICRNGAATPDQFVFVKLFKPKPHDGGVEKMRARVAHDFEVSRRIFEALQSSAGGGAVRPIACYVDHLAIVSEQADGVTLMSHLHQHARWFLTPQSTHSVADTLAAVGRWVRQFQSIEPGTGHVRLPDVRAYIDVRLERLVAHEAAPAAFRQRVLDHLDRLAAQVPDAELADVIVHADLAPGNILIAAGRVVVLDFAMVQRGSALHDISRLYLQLDILRAKPTFRPAVIRALQEALLQAFDPTLTPARPLFRYLSMLHRVNHLATLSLARERFPGGMMSGRVRRLHQRWIEHELRMPASLGHR
jgi:aminoglycoside phosphotransferase (APT) family kinase protein